MCRDIKKVGNHCSMPSFEGQKGFIVSLKLCLNLSEFNLLSLTRSCVRMVNPIGS